MDNRLFPLMWVRKMVTRSKFQDGSVTSCVIMGGAHLTQNSCQLSRQPLFRNEPTRSAFQRGAAQLLGLMQSDQDDLRCGMLFGDSARRVDAIQLRHLYVHQDEIGSERSNNLHGLTAVGSPADDVYVGVLRQEKTHHAQSHRRIVDDERTQPSIGSFWRHSDTLRVVAVWIESPD